MRIIKDTIFSAIQGSYLERAAVRSLLTEDPSKGSFFREDNLVYTGLVDYIIDKLGGTFEIHVTDTNVELPIPIQEIGITPDYLRFDEIEGGGTLRDYQITAAKKAVYKRRGIIESAPGCFTGDTEITDICGTRRTLENLAADNVGCYVHSMDTRDGSMKYGFARDPRCTRTVTQLAYIRVSTGVLLRCTVDHPFLSRSLVYIRADELTAGLYLASSRRNDLSVESVSIQDVEPTRVFDITVSRWENFELSAGPIVHNSGKSEIASAILKFTTTNNYVKRAFFIAGTRFLMNQAASRFELRGLEGVSRFGAGNQYKSSLIQVCVVDSLRRAIQRDRYEVVKDFSECDMLMMDEVHHLSANSWVDIAEMCPAKFRLGLTATVWEDPSKISHDDMYLLGLTGMPLCYISSKVLRTRGFLAEPLITLLGVSEPKITSSRGWKPIYNNGIVKHGPRNSVAISIAKAMYEAGHKVLILVNRIKHGLLLLKYLTELGCSDAYFVKGGDKLFTWLPSGRFDMTYTSIESLNELIRDTDRCILLGSTVVDEGVDLPQVSCIVMCAAMKKYRRTVQRLGRGMRPKEGDNSVYVFDFVDGTHETLMKHSLKRIETYKIEEMQFSPSLEYTAQRAGADLQVFTDLFKWKDIKVKAAEGDDDDW